ncbi:MAG: dihydrofolate reductase [Bacteroidota bacterium]
MQQEVIAIYAASENGVIGKNNDLPWHLPEDFRHFKRHTQGKTIIMGRKTFDSLGKPLPNRRHIVITRNTKYAAEGIEVVHSLNAALALAKAEKEVFIIGGAVLFEEAFANNLIDKVYLTTVHAEVEGDVIFFLPNENNWKITEVDARQADEKNEYAFTFKTLVKAL